MDFIAISGNQCAGKTSVANIVCGKYRRPGIIKFADPIYNTLAVFGQPKNRRFMQGLGDLAKECFGKDIYARLFELRLEEVIRKGDNDVILCDDVRYGFELDVVKRAGFRFVFVDAPFAIREARARAQGLEMVENHNSESEVPELLQKADKVIVNAYDNLGILSSVVSSMLLELYPHLSASDAISDIIRMLNKYAPNSYQIHSIAKYVADKYSHLATGN